MSYPERSPRRIILIPRRTTLDVLRGAATIRIGGGSLLGGVRRVSREPTVGEQDWNKGEVDWRQVVAKQVVQKAPRWKNARHGYNPRTY